MPWILVVVAGAVVGVVTSYALPSLKMPAALCALLGAVGAGAGGMLAHVTGMDAAANWALYAAGMLLAMGFIAGGVLGYTLTSTETRP